MGTVLRKINCPGGTHEDKTPSCAVYANGTGYCFACSSYFKDLSAPTVEVKKESEDLRNTFIYVNKLPLIKHRGLEFHHDSRGYYILWPDYSYYKLRLWAPRPEEPKYLGAKGHKKPWFILRAYEKVNICIITEGEINALSIGVIRDFFGLKYDICSPGGASNFFDTEMKSRVQIFENYSTLLVLVDNDKAGVEAAIKFHTLVKPFCNDIRIKLMDKGRDANEILGSSDGKEKLYQTILEM